MAVFQLHVSCRAAKQCLLRRLSSRAAHDSSFITHVTPQLLKLRLAFIWTPIIRHGEVH